MTAPAGIDSPPRPDLDNAAEVPAAAALGADGPEPDVAGAVALHTKVTAVDAPW